MNPGEFSDRAVLVTGSARGIGRAVALGFAGSGAAVACVDILQDGLKPLDKELEKMGVPHVTIVSDVSSEDAWPAIVDEASGRLGAVDTLVNCAAYAPRFSGDALECRAEEWERVYRTNVVGLYGLCVEVAKRLIELGEEGAIVNVSSGAAKSGGQYVAPSYAASKAAVHAVTLRLARDLARHGIRVNAVAPGFIDTPMLDGLYVGRDSLPSEVPLGRVGTPEEVAQAVLFLASWRASFITGEIVDVNGGDIMD